MLFGGGSANRGLLVAPGRRKSAAEIMGGVAEYPREAPPHGRNGIFGTGQSLPMPGVISGYGGGTWNADGSPATPDRDGGMRPLPGSGAGQAPALEAQEAAPNHWTVEGFERMRSEMQSAAELPRMGMGPLGGSMRQPFDYDAALARLVGEKPKVKDWQKVVGILGDALVAHNGGQPYVMRSLMGRQEDYEKRVRKAHETLLGWQHDDWARQHGADLRAAEPFSSGRDRVQYDPATGQARVIYDGPEDFETYAERLRLEPGTEEYFAAVEDYVLKGNGPTAHSRDLELDDHRTENDRSLETYRYGNRVGLERLRQGNRQGMVDYRNANPPPARPRTGSPRENIVTVKTPAEARKLPPGTKFKTPDGRVKVAR